MGANNEDIFSNDDVLSLNDDSNDPKMSFPHNWNDDITLYYHRNDRTMYEKGDNFAKLYAFLGSAKSKDANVVIKGSNNEDLSNLCRGVVCWCNSNRSIAITLRGHGINVEATDAPEDAKPEQKQAAAEKAAKLNGRWLKPTPNALPSLKATLKVAPDYLAKLILRPVGKASDGEDQTAGVAERLRGLVVVAGETGSGKTVLADGLLRCFLARKAQESLEEEISKAREALKEGKSVHEPIAAVRHVLALGRPVDWKPYNTDKPDDFAPREDSQQTTDLGRFYEAYGIQYTPRILGVDTTLELALIDALRQKPAAVYLDEIREDRDWPAVLRFAQTGHLIITTAHAGSVQDLIAWVLKAMGVQNRSQAPAVVQNIIAVIHVDPRRSDKKTRPELWIGKRGAQMLGAYGLGALVAAADEDTHFIERTFLMEQIDKAALRSLLTNTAEAASGVPEAASE